MSKTAGLTLAARLSENSKTLVLVLEAGDANLDDPNICEYYISLILAVSLSSLFAVRPASYGNHFGNPSYCWDYQTVRILDIQPGLLLMLPTDEANTR